MIEQDVVKLFRTVEALTAENAALVADRNKRTEDITTVVQGFEVGVFVRNTAQDHGPAWAVKLLPYLSALARLTAAVEPRK